MEYKILWHMTASGLSVEVNEHITKGWILYGNPFTCGDTIYQAMTKKPKKIKKGMEEYIPK